MLVEPHVPTALGLAQHDVTHEVAAHRKSLPQEVLSSSMALQPGEGLGQQPTSCLSWLLTLAAGVAVGSWGLRARL